MPYQTEMFYQVTDPGGTLTAITALASPTISTSGTNLQVGENSQIINLVAGVPSGGGGYIQIRAPSLLQYARQYVPGNGNTDADAYINNPPVFQDLINNPLDMVTTEDMEAYSDANTTSSEANWLMVNFADNIAEPPNGPTRTVRATMTATLTADQWDNQSIAFDDNLPAGRYSVTGMRAIGATLVAVRLVFQNQAARPGVPGLQSDNNVNPYIFEPNGGLGSYGEFESTNPPSVDCLATTALSDVDLYLTLVQVRSGPG